MHMWLIKADYKDDGMHLKAYSHLQIFLFKMHVRSHRLLIPVLGSTVLPSVKCGFDTYQPDLTVANVESKGINGQSSAQVPGGFFL